MVKKQVLLPPQIATQIEVRAKNESLSESSFMRKIIVQAISSSTPLSPTTHQPIAALRLTNALERQEALLNFILQSTLLVRNYTGRTFIEVASSADVDDELKKLQQISEEIFQQIQKELNK